MNPFSRIYFARMVILAAVLAPICNSAQTDQATGTAIEKRAKAYEEVCVSSLRVINVAEGIYQARDSATGYARTLKELGPAGAVLLEPVIASGSKDGYRFRLIPEHTARNQPIRHYTITARPIKRLLKNQRSYFTDETGVIRFTTENRAATVADPPVGANPR